MELNWKEDHNLMGNSQKYFSVIRCPMVSL